MVRGVSTKQSWSMGDPCCIPYSKSYFIGAPWCAPLRRIASMKLHGVTRRESFCFYWWVMACFIETITLWVAHGVAHRESIDGPWCTPQNQFFTD